MAAKIRNDLVGVVYARNSSDAVVTLKAGDDVPKGVVVDEHLTEGGESTAVTIPDGEPSEEWKAAELTAYAEREGIDLAGATKKADVVAAIAAARA